MNYYNAYHYTPKKEQKRSRIKDGLKGFVAGLLASYVVVCGYKTYKVEKELKPLKKEFIEVVESYRPKRIPCNNTITGVCLDYDGILDQIIKERDNYLKEINGVIKPHWKVRLDRGWDGKYTPVVSVAIVYNPFTDIPKYKEQKDKQIYKNTNL